MPNGAVIHARGALNTADFYGFKKSIEAYFQHASNPKIKFHLTVRTGSALDPIDKPGVNHFLEHCLCRTRKYPSLDALMEAFEERGGFFNASTGTTEMNFFGELESNPKNLRFLMDYFDEILNDPSFPPEVIERERNRILTEFLEYEDNAQTRVNKALFTHIVRAEGRPIDGLGTEESVENITREDLEAAHAKSFTAANVELSISSTFAPTTVIHAAQKRFKKMPMGTRNEFEDVTFDPDQIIVLDEPESRSSNFTINFHAGDLSQQEIIQLHGATQLLNAYLYREMINKGVVYHCNAASGAINDQYGILITGKVRADSVGGITPSIVAAFEKFADGISSHRYKTTRRDTLREHSGMIPVYRLAHDVKLHGSLQTVGKTHKEAADLMTPDALLTFVRDKILTNPVGIAINGGDNTRDLTEKLTPALDNLRQALQGVVANDPTRKTMLGTIQGLVLPRNRL